jgi:hypothetical protein
VFWIQVNFDTPWHTPCVPDPVIVKFTFKHTISETEIDFEIGDYRHSGSIRKISRR